MLRISRKQAIALSVAAVLGVAASPSFAALTVKNTSRYVGAGRWDWTIFVDADPDTLRQIECVEYILHPTFPDPVHNVCKKPETKFAYSTNGWGTFTVKVNILYKNGRVEALEHPLVFRQQSPPASLSVTARNWSRQIEPGWWEWGVYIEGAPTELDRIRCVEYTLHPTFPNPVRVVCARADRFELTAKGWGTFTVGIKLMLKDGSIRPLSYPLEFR
jgi:transcription initiation factor IIF auxiliary subunit